MAVIGVGFGVVSVVLSRFLGPRNPTPEKLAPYECGMPPVGDARERQSVKFYLVAMIFLLFDIEVAFLYPWAMALRDLGWPGFVQIVVFFLILRRRVRLRLAQGRARLGPRGDPDYKHARNPARAGEEIPLWDSKLIRNPGSDDHRREDGAVGPPLGDLAGHLRPGVLRHRDDGDELPAATTSRASAPRCSAARRASRT